MGRIVSGSALRVAWVDAARLDAELAPHLADQPLVQAA
jgi:hypothetical protein